MRRKDVGFFSVVLAAMAGNTAFGQLSKVDTLLRQYGFQLQAAVNIGAPYYYDGHTNGSGQLVGGLVQANYTTPSYAGSAIFEDSNYPDSSELNGPWAVWNVSDGDFPDQVPADVPHLNNLVSMAIGDELNWATSSSDYTTITNEFNEVNADPNYNNTIVYTNNWLGQLGNNGTTVSNFIQAVHPDMLTFDNYPYLNDNASAVTDSDILNVGDSWYTEMLFYRNVTLDNSYQPSSSDPNYSVDWGLYRQTYATYSSDPTQYTRTPSATEYAVETFTAMAFNAKMEMDFWFNGSSSQLYTDQNQDATTALYAAVQHVNQEAANFGRTMIYLTPMDASPEADPNGSSDILFLRGETTKGDTSTLTTLPEGFVANGGVATAANSSFTSAYLNNKPVAQPWTTAANDPWMTGFGQINIGKAPVYLGDAIISWFRPLGESKQDVMDPSSPDYGDIYFMVVNALSTPTTSDPSDCLQDIHMDFTSWPLAPGQTEPEIQYVDPTTGQIELLTLDSALDGDVTNSSIYPAGTFLLTKTSADGTGKLRLNVFLDGGDAFLFKFYTGDAFLVPEPGTLSLAALAGLAMLRRSRRK